MKSLDPNSLDKSQTAFTTDNDENLQVIRDRESQSETGTRRRDLLSALDRLADLTGIAHSAIATSSTALRLAFSRINAPAARLSRKSLQNIKSGVLQAVKRYGPPKVSLTKRIPLTPMWHSVVDLIVDNQRRYGMHRIACYGSAVGIEPQQFTSPDLMGFYQAVEHEGVLKDPKKTLNQAITGWNWCARHIRGWPTHRLGSPLPSTRYRRPLEAFSESFRSDLTLWRSRLLDNGAMMFEGPIQKHRPNTVECQTNALLRFASLLVKQSIVQLDQFNALADIVRPSRVKAGLFAMKGRGAKISYMRQTAVVLLKVARHHCHLPESEIEELSGYLRHLPRQRGMTDKNLELLKQFDDQENVAHLFGFPAEERRRGLRETNPIRQAKRFERALFVEILLWTALRMQNMRTIKFKENIRWSRGECILTFGKSEMKNGCSFEHFLPEHVAMALKTFVSTYRPRLPGSSGPYLFPGPSGGPKHHATLGGDFTKVMWTRCGLVITPHLVRHLIAHLLVSDDPQLLEVVAQHLGHKTSESTRTYYLPNGSRSASRAFAKILEERLDKIRKSRKGGPK